MINHGDHREDHFVYYSFGYDLHNIQEIGRGVQVNRKIGDPKEEEETNNEDESNINIVIQFVHTPRGDTF